ncbi:hypothetical protein MA16_Dca005076 [Dendrobium catenatum]|uniref:Uncharacterized protein n=1 Tax=Dendrobium catenatum TaxID=906689 RepID=A0A2I0WGU2_9ASPA|nr:hypothetical protein MA16_Dca005076 [Dendrobium catenatum]
MVSLSFGTLSITKSFPMLPTTSTPLLQVFTTMATLMHCHTLPSTPSSTSLTTLSPSSMLKAKCR